MTLPEPPLPQGDTAKCREIFSAVISPTGESECVSEHVALPAVWDAAKGAHFSLTPYRVLNCELLDWGQEASGRAADGALGGC